MAKRSKPDKTDATAPIGNPYLAAGLAWLIPGAGHVYLSRRGRGVAFFAIVLASLGVGVSIDGGLPWQFSDAPLATLATLGALGSGLPCLFLRLVVGVYGGHDSGRLRIRASIYSHGRLDESASGARRLGYRLG